MHTSCVRFAAPWTVEYGEVEMDPAALSDHQVLVDTECTVVSAGTELAVLSGGESWAKLPFIPGYGSVGRVVEAGKAVQGFKPGDRIFSYGRHQASVMVSGMLLPVPAGLDPAQAVLARMGQVAYTAVRVSEAEIGDHVAVIGMGLVGNLAAQLFTLAGCTVIGIDILEKRLAIARACGIEYALNSRSCLDLAKAAREITGGEMCHTVVEATGIPSMVSTASMLTGKLGEVVLLGTPRGESHENMVELLRRVHLWGNCVTLKGAHEWRTPPHRDPQGHCKHSLERNVEQFMAFADKKKLRLRELITHVCPPSQCAEVYRELRNRNEDYFGVVFDWTAM